MSLFFTPRKFSAESKEQAVRELLENAVPDRDFYLLVIGAIILAAAGILTDSIPVLIASMIVAPLAYPILALGLGIVVRDGRLIFRSLGMILISIVSAIVIAGFFSLFAKSYFTVVSERVFVKFFPNYFFDILIAVISGAIASYGLIRTKVGAAMTGIGIAVSLMPPLVAIGIGLFDQATAGLASRAFMIFILNILGILAASIITFLFFGLQKQHRAVSRSNNFK